MKKERIIEIATLMGLKYDKEHNFPSVIKKGDIYFDGCNGQRFLLCTWWYNKKFYTALGEYLILMGKRLKCMEIHDVISINAD